MENRGRQKGCVKTGGRKVGTPNKSTGAAKDRLLAHGCDLDKAVADAIRQKDYEMLKAITPLLQYYQPKFKDIDASPSSVADDSRPLAAVTPTQLASLINGTN